MSTTSYTTTLPPQPQPFPLQPSCVSDDYESADDEEAMVQEEEDTKMTYCCVTFADSDQVHEIPSRDTFTTEEIRSAHYNKEDYKEMKRDASETIQLYHLGKLSESDCFRGLECRTQAGFNFVKNNRLRASFAVIDEQDRQDEIGINDPNLISDVYQKSSLSCRCYAYAIGLFDEMVMKDEEVVEGTWDDAISASLITVQCQTIDPISSDDQDVDAPQLDSMEWTAEAA